MSHERLHVAMYTPSAAGGHARYTHELLSAIANLPDQDRVPKVSLVTSTNLDPHFRNAPYEIADVLPALRHRSEFPTSVHWALSRTVFYAWREHHFLNWLRSRPDVTAVHLQEYSPWHAPRDFRVIRKLNMKIYMTVHNIQPHQYLPLVPDWAYDACSRITWRMADVLFVHSERLKDDLSAFLEGDHPPIVVMPHGVWTTPPIANASPKAPRQPPRLLFFGQLREDKGIDVLLDAMRALPDCMLTIAGEPESETFGAEVRALVNTVSHRHIQLMDRFIDESELPYLFADADLVVLPYTRFSAQSGVLHDAVAYGLPVVATDVGAIGDSVREWGVGTIAAPAAAAGLADAIRTMLEPEHYAAAVAASCRARDRLSWAGAARIAADVYLESGHG